MIKLEIEKLIFGGQALSRQDDKVFMVWNALPGEQVEAEVVKKKKNVFEAVARKIIKASPSRVNPKEEHFLSCSPWQILSWDQENLWKKQIAQETYEKLGKFSPPGIDIIFSDVQYGYRNKMEYSFAQDDNGKISLGFFGRGSHRPYPIQPCQLADKAINKVASLVVDWLNQNSVPVQSLKTLVLRANDKGQVIAGLFIKDKLELLDLPVLNDVLQGFYVYLSDPRSPMALPDELLAGFGNDFLEASVKDTALKYGLLSFFQINVPLFEKALEDIGQFLDADKTVVDFYAGVGAISLPLSEKYKECLLVESNEDAVGYARENIRINGISNANAIFLPAEKALEFITKDKVIIFDPPRPGLHKKIAMRVLEEKPSRIIYLSCNISTQARDIEWLSSAYKVSFARLYNFFPRTPHIEGLCVLDRK